MPVNFLTTQRESWFLRAMNITGQSLEKLYPASLSRVSSVIGVFLNLNSNWQFLQNQQTHVHCACFVQVKTLYLDEDFAESLL